MRSFHNNTRLISLLTIFIFFLSACASTNIPPFSAQNRSFQLLSDEQELWNMSAKEETRLQKSGRLYQDRLLEEYLTSIAHKMMPEEVREQIGAKVGVVKDPSLNAFAYPNGMVYLHTGLLARLENEAQLAFIVGHELTHVTNRHAVRYFRDARNKQLGFTIVGILGSIGLAALGADQSRQGRQVTGAVISQTGNALLGLGLQLGLLASINGYGREMESEADEGGIKSLIAAGYDPREIPRVFELFLQTEKDQSAVENFFFSNHPMTRTRLARSQELLEKTYADAVQQSQLVTNSEEFQRRTRVLIRENALLDFERGRYQAAKASLEKVIETLPNDPKAHYYLGEVYRKSGKTADDLQRAAEEYQLAIKADSNYPDPYKALGFLYYKEREGEKAREAFQRYLDLKPKAEDAEMIKEYLRELGADS
ncbi:MAG: M48 family metalloprotease [Candidatus Tectomicrobia bacterium]|nr:M48 family metalloprotease [Candidatus Tectomicrobia bacterium]